VIRLEAGAGPGTRRSAVTAAKKIRTPQLERPRVFYVGQDIGLGLCPVNGGKSFIEQAEQGGVIEQLA